MGMLQFLYNSVENVSDILNGRFTSFSEVVQGFVNEARLIVGEFVKHRFYKEPDRIANFLLHQMVLLSKAESILRLRSAFEILGNREDPFTGTTNYEVLSANRYRAYRVFSAMRYELNKYLEDLYYSPTFLFAFRNVLDRVNSVYEMECQEERYLGFKIIKEYSTVKSNIEGLVHEGIQSFYRDYISKIYNLAFECLEKEVILISSEKGIDVWRDRTFPEWKELYNRIYSRYEISMRSAKVTDISKDFVKLF